MHEVNYTNRLHMKNSRSFRTYEALSRISFLKKSYALKFLFVAFIGTHIPLLGILAATVYRPDFLSPGQLLITSIGLTLTAAGFTLIALNALLRPVIASEKALTEYYRSRTLPNLPLNHGDEAGTLMNKLRKTLGKLEDHLEDKSDIASMLSHDLRTPMIQFAGVFGLIKEEDDKSQINSLCDKMIAESQKRLRFLEEMLTKIKADNPEDEVEELISTPVSAIVIAAADSMRCHAAKKGVELTVKIDRDHMLRVTPLKAESAVQNLISNAIKFSYPGQAVSICTGLKDSKVCISVKDEGVGFDEKTSMVLFKKFAKGQAGTQGETSTGFGLYSVKKTIEAHGGQVSAVSKGADRGARFDIVLPSA